MLLLYQAHVSRKKEQVRKIFCYIYMSIEYLDDLPLLGKLLLDSDVANLLDKHFPDHGSWQGISGGKLAVGWLMYILSEGDHRLSHVETWAAKRLHVLRAILGEEGLREVDFCDDRLARLLSRYSDDTSWEAFEVSLGRHLLQVYSLVDTDECKADMPAVIRADSFNVPQYRTADGLFGFGHHKQRRPDQPFCKAMVATLDPFAMPLAVDIAKGSGPDTAHYLPVIMRVRRMIPHSGNLYVGDSNLGSHDNRLQIARNGDYYLCPLSRKQCSVECLNAYLTQLPSSLRDMDNIFTEQGSKRKAAYFQELTETVSEQDESWLERRILVYSPDYASGLVKSFDNRLDEAQAVLKTLVESKKGRRNPKTLKDLHVRCANVLKKFSVEGFFEIQCTETVEERQVQRYKNRQTTIRKSITLHLNLERKEELIEQQRQRLGWQLYATNVPEERMDAKALVLCYRDEYRIEHLFDYLINRDVGLLPIYLKKQERVKGLVRFLTIAMRAAARIQYLARLELLKDQGKINGVYPGNKNRATDQPTTPMLLRAFNGLAVAWMELPNGVSVQMPPLDEVQNRILHLLGMDNLYEQTTAILKTQMKITENC